MLGEIIELRRMANSIEVKHHQQKENHLTSLYFLAINTILKTKSCYPLKPGGVVTFLQLQKIKCSLDNVLEVFESKNLRLFRTFLKRISKFHDEAMDLQAIFNMIKKIASIINKNYPSEDSAKKSLCSYVSSLHSSSDVVVSWIAYLKRILPRWLPKLFQFVSYPFLPKTNNDLEHFNLKIKKLFRKISGRKNSHLFLLSSGVPLTYFLSANSYSFDFCYSFSHQEMISERNHLFQISKKSAIYSIKNQLEEFLFNLEIVASEKD